MFDPVYYLKRCFFLCCYLTLEMLMAVWFWGRKKTVPPVRNPLLLKSATTLAREIRERKLKSENVIQAYIDRISEVNPIINAVVKDNFDVALKEAKHVDNLIESEKFSSEELSREKPLLGVPFTVKCCFSVKGFPHTVGSYIFKDNVGTCDAPCVVNLKKAGGIFLALTNCPEFSTSLETSNHLYGRTYNPYDTTKAPGGSSGGEAALISSAGSVIGIGTDIYGSVRMPASFCGIFGCKPTMGWTSNEGLLPKIPSTSEHFLECGPLCRYSEDLPIMLKVLSKKEKPIDLMPKVNFKKLKIYYQTDAKYVYGVSTNKEIAQAVRNAAFYFQQKYGAEIEEINIPLLNKCNGIVGHVFRKGMSKADFIKCVTDGQMDEVKTVPELIKAIFGKAQFTLFVLLLLSLSYTRFVSHDEDIPLHEEFLKKLEREFEEILNEKAIFLSPTTATTAVYHNQSLTHAYSAYWTGVFNLIGLPATQCPMGLNNNNMPIGIQIASCKGNEALTIACANELEKVFGGWIPPQTSLC